MTYKQIQCRTHGGMFPVASKRGRPPVRCTPENKCTHADKHAADDVMEAKARITAREVERRTTKPKATGVAKVTVQKNPSIPMAFKAKELLEPKGWQVKGRAWFEDTGKTDTTATQQIVVGMAELTAVRGDELLTMVWVDGKLTDQQYSMWNTEKPSENGKPRSHLEFEPDETSDRELVKLLAGRPVSWWNKLGSRNESAVVAKDKVEIVHNFNGLGDETPDDRIVRFVAIDGGGFRAFRIGALLKVN